MILVSACLAGFTCKWDGGSKPCPLVIKLIREGRAIPVCPEQLGGFCTPRDPAEIEGGNGKGVLAGKVKVINKKGEDVTARFLKGAQETLKIAKKFEISTFIGKSKSPSCGSGLTYDGTFSGKVVEGDGVTVVLLKENGIKVIPDDNLKEFI